MNVLAQADLVRVVRTEKVRALVAKYWGRTARVFYYHRIDAAVGSAQRTLEQSAAEVARLESSGAEGAILDVNRRDARIPAARAEEFNQCLADLLIEFADEPRSGSQTYGMLYGLYRSERGALPEPGARPERDALPEPGARPERGAPPEPDARPTRDSRAEQRSRIERGAPGEGEAPHEH